MEKTGKQTSNKVVKVVLFGPESTGKTTLAAALAAHFNTDYVPEYSREYAEQKLKEGSTLTKNDVLPIAMGQMQLEQTMLNCAKEVLIYDTNILETLVYASYLYKNDVPEELKKYAELNEYDLYLLTDIDVPFTPDPVRGDGTDRAEQFQLFKQKLEQINTPFVVLSGSFELRLQKAIMAINEKVNEFYRTGSKTTRS